jgi:hypothetical protein
VEWQEADGYEADEKDDGEGTKAVIIEVIMQDDHGHLAGQAEAPDKEKDQADSVQLMMDELVVLVHLEDEGVVEVVLPEGLHSESCCYQDENQDGSEVVYVDSRCQYGPIILSFLLIILGGE